MKRLIALIMLFLASSALAGNEEAISKEQTVQFHGCMFSCERHLSELFKKDREKQCISLCTIMTFVNQETQE